MTEPISSDERLAAQDALYRLRAGGRLSNTDFVRQMQIATTATERAEFDALINWLPQASDGRWSPVPAPKPRPDRFTPTGVQRTPKQVGRKLAKDYLLPLLPVVAVYLVVMGIVGPESAAYLPIGMSFWPVMFMGAFIISRIRKHRDDILFPARPEPTGPQDEFDANRS